MLVPSNVTTGHTGWSREEHHYAIAQIVSLAACGNAPQTGPTQAKAPTACPAAAAAVNAANTNAAASGQVLGTLEIASVDLGFQPTSLNVVVRRANNTPTPDTYARNAIIVRSA